jgi:hypothetical protein
MLHPPVLGERDISHKRMKQNWSIKADIEDFRPFLNRFEAYLKGNGLRDSTVDDYAARVGRFLRYAQDCQPSIDVARSFREKLVAKNLARSTINNYSFAIKSYYKMYGIEVDFLSWTGMITSLTTSMKMMSLRFSAVAGISST